MTTRPPLELPTRYDHAAAEAKWYARWEAEGAFRADVDSPHEHFTMVIPPPNVTGALHMGHALNNTIQDIYARYWRMKGREVLWLPGTDHAGIATQNVVEKELKKEGRRRDDLGRERFIKRVWEWKAESGGTIVRQLRRLGASCDWSRERFTMDEGLSRAVVEVFVRLHAEDLVYRADRLVNWCTRCRTALSDIEVEHVETKGSFWHIRYPFADGSGHVIIATTRPETMLGDTAVAVHPDDERYASIVGKHVILPLVGRRLPVIADAYVDREFGTGVVKITPAHDPNDYEIGLRHNLPMIKAFTDVGTIADAILKGAIGPDSPRHFIGMRLADCRKAIVADLESAGLLGGIEDHKHAVGQCYRCRTPIEPYLTPQWFVKAKPLAEAAMKAVEDGRTRIVPAHWSKTYFEWMRNIRDWCISRQIWWGHQIPAWYCRTCEGDRIRVAETGEVLFIDKDAKPIVAASSPCACPKCGGSELARDPDVLDTWFSSALWPFSTLGWPDETRELKRFYPTSLLVTGFDILFFWVARMMMMGMKIMNEVPFREVYIHALVRDAEGKKMSKSKGNVIDPLAVVGQWGTDAFRFTLAVFCAQGRDIKLDEKRIEGYRNFVTKIWNSARLVLGCRDGSIIPAVGPELNSEALGGNYRTGSDLPEDAWIRSRLSRAVSAVTTAIENYQIDKAAEAIYSFYWSEFCDWYVEMAKPRLRSGDAAAQVTAREVLTTSLALMHPMMPFVTEELHSLMKPGEGFLDHVSFPEPSGRALALEAEFETLLAIITEIRHLRAEFRIPPGERIDVTVIAPEDSHLHRKPAGAHIKILARVGELRVETARMPMTQYASSVVGSCEIMIPLGGRIDLEDARTRLRGEIESSRKLADLTRKKLENEGFVASAPGEVVTEARELFSQRSAQVERLEALLANL